MGFCNVCVGMSIIVELFLLTFCFGGQWEMDVFMESGNDFGFVVDDSLS